MTIDYLSALEGVAGVARLLREAIERPHTDDCSCGTGEFRQLCAALDVLDEASKKKSDA
jgi:hypothetical protein